jgi:hypothetical protein
MRVHPAIERFGRSIAASCSAVVRSAGRHLGFLVGLLLVAIVIGIAYRYLFDPLEQRTLPYYIRSSLHAIGLALSGWAVHVGFASVPRSRSSGVLRRLPLPAEFAIKAFAMTAVLTIVAVSLQFVLYRELFPQHWLIHDLPSITAISFSVSLVTGAIFELRRLVGGRVLGSFLLGTYHRPITFTDMAATTH